MHPRGFAIVIVIASLHLRCDQKPDHSFDPDRGSWSRTGPPYVHARGERSREDISPIIHILSLFFIFVTRLFENWIDEELFVSIFFVLNLIFFIFFFFVFFIILLFLYIFFKSIFYINCRWTIIFLENSKSQNMI